MVDSPEEWQSVADADAEVVDVGDIVDHQQNTRCILVDQVRNEDLLIEG